MGSNTIRAGTIEGYVKAFTYIIIKNSQAMSWYRRQRISECVARVRATDTTQHLNAYYSIGPKNAWHAALLFVSCLF